MENILNKPYEISLWDDDLVFRVTYRNKNNEIVDTRDYFGSLESFEPIADTTTEITQFYKERKICIIGSNTMETPISAKQGKIVSNINGSNTLTFSMYSRYYDEETDDFFDNPFLKLLVNERKVKLRYGTLGSADCKWYDFIVKEIREESESKTFQYTCKDLFTNELSKTGFDIQLDPKLENNMGNITTLADVILDGSDWRRGTNNDIILQTTEEPLYKTKVVNGFIATDMQTGDKIDIMANEYVYGFYDIVTNEEPYYQFLYCKDGDYRTDDDHVITNSPNYALDGVTYIDGIPDFAYDKGALEDPTDDKYDMQISSEYRGNRLVRQAITKFDSTIDKYVHVYKKDNTEYYGYTKTEYITPTSVKNYVTNPEGFKNDTGWEIGGYLSGEKTIYPILEVQGYPDIRDIKEEDLSKVEEFRSFLLFRRENSEQALFNSGFNDSRTIIKTLAKDDKYKVRVKFFKGELNEATGRVSKITAPVGEQIDFEIGQYKLKDGIYTIEESFFSGTLTALKDDWASTEVSCKVNKSQTDLLNSKVGIFLRTPLNENILLENFQIYKSLTYEQLIDGKVVMVEAEPGGELFSSAKTKYTYYLPNPDYKSAEDVVPSYTGYEPNKEYIQQFNDNAFEKIRSITATESNRFNMIQDLCEIFECWARFEIEHNMQTGEILLDNDLRQKKWITFHEYIGQDNYAGFKYGINLKAIQRTLNSDGVVSKIIVKPNSNEFAPNGFCSIARAPLNTIGENFIYSFDYYIQQGLIGFSEINNDLYLDSNGYLGYYKKLKDVNSQQESLAAEGAKLVTDISQYESSYQAYKGSVEETEKELRNTEQYIIKLTGYDYVYLKQVANKAESKQQLTEEEERAYSWWQDEKLVAEITKIPYLKSTINVHSKLRDEYKKVDAAGKETGKLVEAQKRFSEIEKSIEDITNKKRILNLKFYKKYSRFIQEGSWISEDYIDENLYYLDAKSTLNVSARPKVTYDINVLELSQLEEYKNYTFNLGDKTYIEDTEFFGWVWSQDGIRSPYREEIVVSEISVELDSPEKNNIKVQNFKTQFEDLFQRMTATTQSIEYHTGEYSRAASIVETDGTIAASTLENSLTNNAIRLENVKDQSVVWDETGITTTNLSNPSEIVRIISGGIFMSTDGGVTWNTGITGSGMNANFLTTGQINTSSINIMSGSFPSFRWDDKGVSAYEFSVSSDTGKAQGFNTAKFVRYDQYGLYGINGYSNFDPNKIENGLKGEEKIWKHASFALTWKGFQLKNKYGNGYVAIDSVNDFVVNDGSRNRIKIGNLGGVDAPIYGMQINDASGNIVMETNSDGTLWLKDKLNIGTWNSNHKVGLGKLDKQESQDEIHGGRVIDANNKFLVFEDGYINATGGRFEGEIYATGGKIGGLTIEEWSQAGYEVAIESSNGTVFKNDVGTPITTLKIVLYKGGKKIIPQSAEYSWSKNGQPLENNGSSYVVYEITKNSVDNYTCTVNFKIDQVSSKGTGQLALAHITDGIDGKNGTNGKNGIVYEIESSNGFTFTSAEGELSARTTLTARIEEGGVDIDPSGTIYNYSWYYSNNDSVIGTGKKIDVTLQFSQEVSKKQIYFIATAK